MNERHFAHWPRRLPRSLVYPKVPLFELLETSARRYPDRTAMIFYGARISFSQYWQAVEKLAGALAALGVEKGDRVALYLQNTPHFTIGFMGILRANAVVVPLNPMLTAEETAGLLADSGAKVLITTADLYPNAESACQRAGADPRRIEIGHMSDNLDIDYQIATLERGVFVAWDRMGLQGIVGCPMDEQRYDVLAELIRCGYAGQIMISHDFIINWLGRPLNLPEPLLP
jgi:fatty-acyl-CoA synthase